MKKPHLLIILLVAFCYQLNMVVASDISTLDSLSARNIFYTNQSQRCIIDLGYKVLKTADHDQNTKLQFTTKQTIINALCIEGRVNEAISLAEQMHTLAYNTKDTIGLALTLESFGNIYLYVGLDQQATDILGRIAPYLENKQEPSASLMLQILQTQAYLNLDMNAQAFVHISEAERLLQLNNLINRDIYGFYILCYKTIFDLSTKKYDAAERGLKLVVDFPDPDGVLGKWKDYVLYKFYFSHGNFSKAIEHCKWTEGVSQYSYNRIRGLNRLAELLTESDENKKAGELYQTAKTIADTLFAIQNIMPLDSLTTQYYANVATSRNNDLQDQFMVSVIKYGVLVSLLTIAMGLILWFESSKKKRTVFRTKLARKKEIESVRAQDKLISTISNEFRTPLNAIYGFASVLSELDDADKEEAEISLNYIIQNSILLIDNLDAMNQYELLRKGEAQLSLAPHNITLVCKELTNKLRMCEQVVQNNIEVIFESSNDDITVLIDIHYFTTLINNLLSNAMKFTTEGHIALKITTDSPAKCATIIVEDTGVGIPVNRRPQVFGALSKVNDNTSGIGIGLTVCRYITTLMGGQIGFDNNYTNGTRVVVTIPLTYTTNIQAE